MLEQELQSLLEKEIEVLEELNKVSLLKKEALLNDDLNSLEEIVLTEERLSQSLKKIDDACSPQVQFFLTENPYNISSEVKDLLIKLRHSALNLRLTNQFNQELLKDSINIIHLMLNSITDGETEDNNTYSSAGKIVKNKATKSLLDFKG